MTLVSLTDCCRLLVIDPRDLAPLAEPLWPVYSTPSARCTVQVCHA